jgi:hypothetical protein
MRGTLCVSEELMAVTAVVSMVSSAQGVFGKTGRSRRHERGITARGMTTTDAMATATASTIAATAIVRTVAATATPARVAKLRDASVEQLLNADGFVIAMNDVGHRHAYPSRVRFEIGEGDLSSYQRAADDADDVQSRTAVAYAAPYTQSMKTEYVKPALMAAWVVAVGALGYASGTSSFAGWAIVAALSLVPPAIMVRLWRVPSPSMSESIREVLR